MGKVFGLTDSEEDPVRMVSALAGPLSPSMFVQIKIVETA
jgi:hypothetical protein